jgi:hypothetical protein
VGKGRPEALHDGSEGRQDRAARRRRGRGGDRQVDRSDGAGYQDPMASAAPVTDDDIPF